MNFDRMFGALAITGSGMTAQRVRMDVVAENIAHAEDMNRGDGKPYRRKEVVFETLLDKVQNGMVHARGVVEDDKTPLPVVHRPDSPYADKDGNVTMPNVTPVFEMVDMLSASRAYEANLQASRQFKSMIEQALQLGR